MASNRIYLEGKFAQLDPIDTYMKITGRNGGDKYFETFDVHDFELILDMDQESTINYLNQSYKFRKLPVIDSLQIFGVKQIYNNLIYFLTLIDRYNIRKFSFGGRQTERYNGEDVISIYMQSLESSFPSKDVKIINCYLNNSSVDSLLELCESVRRLTFDRCRFDLESDTSINNKGSKAETLTFSSCYQDDLKSMDLSFIKKIANKNGNISCSCLAKKLHIEYAFSSKSKENNYEWLNDSLKALHFNGYSFDTTEVIDQPNSNSIR